MAKAKRQKAPGQYAGTVADEKFYYLPSGLLVKADGTPVEPGQAKRYAALLEPFVPQTTQSKEVLEEAFPETYEEPREKKRRTTKKNIDVEQKEAAEKLAAEYKRDIDELKNEISAMTALMREDTALIRQQLTVQQRSITLLTEIAKNITSGGGKLNVPSITKGFGWKGMLAAGLGGLALGGVGGYLLNQYLSQDEETDAAELVPEQQEQPQQTVGIQEAQQRGEQKTDIVTINARELAFNSDKLSFEVNELIIDSDNIKTEGRPGVGGGGGGGGGGPSGAGPAGGATMKTPQGEFKTGAITPSFGGYEGGAGAYQGFSGKSPTVDSVKEDVSEAMKFKGGGQGGSMNLEKVSGEGRPSAKQLYDYLTSKGASANEARMLTSAAMAESNLNPSVTHDNGTGYGLWGHNLQRLDLRGKDWKQQSDAALNELKTSSNDKGIIRARQILGNANASAAELTEAQMHYERPQGYTSSNPQGGHNWQGRLRNTQGLMDLNVKQQKVTQQEAPSGLISSGLTMQTGGMSFQPAAQPTAAPTTRVTNEPTVQPNIPADFAKLDFDSTPPPAKREQLQSPQSRLRSSRERMVAGMEEGKTRDASTLVPPEPPAPPAPPTPPPAQSSEFSGSQPTVTPDKSEETIPGMISMGIHPAFMYLFPKEKKANIGIGQ